MGFQNTADDNPEINGEQIFQLQKIKNDDILEKLVGSKAKDYTKFIQSQRELEVDFGETDYSNQMIIDDESGAMVESSKRMDEDYKVLQQQSESESENENANDSDDSEGDGLTVKNDRKMEQYLDMLYDSLLERREKQKKFFIATKKKASQINQISHLDAPLDREDVSSEEDNTLLLNKNVPTEQDVDQWFDQPIFEGLNEDQDERESMNKKLKRVHEEKKQIKDHKRKREEEETLATSEHVNKKKKSLVNLEKQLLHNDDDSEEDIEDQIYQASFPPLQEIVKEKKEIKTEKKGATKELDFEIVPIGPDPNDFDIEEQAEILALGKQLMNPKTRASLLEKQFNKFSFDDSGTNLPHWFVQDESFHNVPSLPITKEEIIEQKKKSQSNRLPKH